MPAPVLRHYSAAPATNAATAITPAVGPGRALVVSRLSITAETAATIYVAIGATSTNGGMILKPIVLGANETYEGSGQILIAGESLWATVNAGAPNTTISVFGEEVDN